MNKHFLFLLSRLSSRRESWRTLQVTQQVIVFLPSSLLALRKTFYLSRHNAFLLSFKCRLLWILLLHICPPLSSLSLLGQERHSLSIWWCVEGPFSLRQAHVCVSIFEYVSIVSLFQDVCHSFSTPSQKCMWVLKREGEKNKEEKLYEKGTEGLIEVTWGRERETEEEESYLVMDRMTIWKEYIFIQLNIHSPYGETMMFLPSFDEVASLPLKIWKKKTSFILSLKRKEKVRQEGEEMIVPLHSILSLQQDNWIS